MRRTKRTGNFLLTLLFNMLLNLEWGIPALVLLILHFVMGLAIWWFVGAMAFWILCMITGMWIIGWARDCGDTPDPPKENKNPYSNKKSDFNKRKN